MIRPACLDSATWRRFVDAQPPVCVDPGPHGGDLTVDHIVPRARGGPHDLSNLQWLCRACNTRKAVAEDPRWRDPTWFDRPLHRTALRGGQDKLRETMLEHAKVFGRPISQNSGLLWLVCWITGSGKTIGMAIAALVLNAIIRLEAGRTAPRVRRMLVITKELSIRRQIARELHRDLVRFGIVDGAPRVKEIEGRDDFTLRNLETADIWVVCMQTIWERGRQGFTEAEIVERLNAFEIIHLDEPHWAFPHEFQRVVTLAYRAIVLGWTATPIDIHGRLLTGGLLLSQYTYEEANERDGSVKYIPELSELVTEVDIEEYERYRAGVRGTGHAVAQEPDYDLNWRPVTTIASEVVHRLAALDRVLPGGGPAPHRPPGVETDVIYPAHAIIRVMSIQIALRLERWLNELFRNNPQRFDPKKGWRAKAVHSGTLLYGEDEAEPIRIPAEALTPDHPWFEYKRSEGKTIGARILIVVGMGILGVSNPPCCVIGLATSVGSTTQHPQFDLGRPIRAMVIRGQGSSLRVPPATLDRIHLITHPAYGSRPAIEQAVRYVKGMSTYLEGLPTIDLLYEDLTDVGTPAPSALQLSIVEKVRLFLATRDKVERGESPEPVSIVETVCGPASEARQHLARVLVQKIIQNPRAVRDEIVPPPDGLDQLDARTVILRELPKDPAPDDPTLLGWLERDHPDVLDVVRLATPEVWSTIVRPLILKMHADHVRQIYRPLIALDDDTETIEGIRRGYARDALAEFWPRRDAPKEARDAAHAYVGQAVKDLLGEPGTVHTGGEFDTVDFRTVLRAPLVARLIRGWVRAKLVHGGHVPAFIV
jgi:HNH endonuclease/Type III restriction enzyme, res subunit